MKQQTLLIFIALILFAGFFVIDRWKEALYYGDSNSYYIHTVSFLLYGDVGDYDQTITALREVNPASPDPREDVYGIRLTEKGRRYIKYTLGVPLMEAPFFLLAHAYASWSPSFEANGWTKPYLLIVSLSTLVYLLLGIHLLMRVMARYFSSTVNSLVVLALVLATNLFYHATYVTMAHGFLFFDYCLLIYLTEKYYKRPGLWKALAIGGVVGLISLTRVPEVVSLLIPVLWGVGTWDGLTGRLRFFLRQYHHVLAVVIGFLLIFSLQFGYWYFVSGQLVFNPYQGEGFDFSDPKIHKGWFDFANGWLVYTPIMGFSLIGLTWLPKYRPGILLSILSFLFLHIYIHYSYYAWTYFPGLGQRPMVETYPLLAFGLGAFFAFCYKKKRIRWLPIASLWVFGSLNLFQTWQMRQGIIWTERGNHAFYWETFGTITPISIKKAFAGRRMPSDKIKIIL